MKLKDDGHALWEWLCTKYGKEDTNDTIANVISEFSKLKISRTPQGFDEFEQKVFMAHATLAANGKASLMDPKLGLSMLIKVGNALPHEFFPIARGA